MTSYMVILSEEELQLLKQMSPGPTSLPTTVQKKLTSALSLPQVVEQAWYPLGLALVAEDFLLPEIISDQLRDRLERIASATLEATFKAGKQ